jgi:hypothetical protein
MNRAFLIIIGPALFVALLYIGVGRRLAIPMQAGIWLLAACGVALLFRRRKSHTTAGR